MALKNKKSNFSKWYTEVIQKADIVDYGPVSGTMVMKPNGYSLWENAKKYFDKKIKKDGVRNVYFPMLIPERLLVKEAKHIEGFAPEVAWVTHGGKSKLKERLALRPTSETIIYDSYSKWIRSWKDLPLRYNQWANIVRWEFKHPTPFLRTREFLWQEGHSVFATREEAEAEVQKILIFYKDLFEKVYAVPVLVGIKSKKEAFAGAEYTLSVEALMPDGKAIQAATSHYLGQNFSKSFGISFLDQNTKKQFAYQTSWGFSTRSLGILLATHGDDRGLVIPPKMAENKVVIIPIIFKKDKEKVVKITNELKYKILKKYNPILDDREGYSSGWKYNEWEIKGIPVRVEIGPRDVAKRQAVVVRRDTNEKKTVKLTKLDAEIQNILKQMQSDLLNRSKEKLSEAIVDVGSIKDLKKVVSNGKIARAYWCGSPKVEDEIKKKTGAKSITGEFAIGTNFCILTGKPATHQHYFGKSY